MSFKAVAEIPGCVWILDATSQAPSLADKMCTTQLLRYACNSGVDAAAARPRAGKCRLMRQSGHQGPTAGARLDGRGRRQRSTVARPRCCRRCSTSRPVAGSSFRGPRARACASRVAQLLSVTSGRFAS